MIRYLVILAVFIICSSFCLHTSGIFIANNSSVSFISKASLGKIKGTSTELKGSLDIHKRTFEFTLPICSFQGFLNSTQKRHYCDKFVEGPKFPETGFKGKIIEDVDLSKPGSYTVRGKGMFLLHGIEKEMIIAAQITIKEGGAILESKFDLPLEEHGINVSKMNSLSMAKIIAVDVKIGMIPGS